MSLPLAIITGIFLGKDNKLPPITMNMYMLIYLSNNYRRCKWFILDEEVEE